MLFVSLAIFVLYASRTENEKIGFGFPKFSLAFRWVLSSNAQPPPPFLSRSFISFRPLKKGSSFSPFLSRLA